MKKQIVELAVKAAPHVKKWGTVAATAVVAAMTEISNQKKAAELLDMKNRIADLEKLVKKD